MNPEAIAALRGLALLFATPFVARRLRGKARQQATPRPVVFVRWSAVGFVSIFLALTFLMIIEMYQSNRNPIGPAAVLLLGTFILVRIVPSERLSLPLASAFAAMALHEMRPFLASLVETHSNNERPIVGIFLWIPEGVLTLIAVFYVVRYIPVRLGGAQPQV